MNPLAFGSIYLGSWLLMGLGVFLAFRISSDLRQMVSVRVPSELRAAASSWAVRASVVGLVVLVSVGITYAGAYTFYNLMFAK